MDTSRSKLRQFEKYVCNVFALPDLLAKLTDQRRDPKISTFDVVNSLFHTAVLRIPSINALEGDLKEGDFQKLIGRQPMQDVSCFAWTLAISLLTGNVGLDRNSGTEASAAPAARPYSAQAQPPPQQDQAQAQQMQLPEVNLTPDGLDELLAPIALYPDPVLAVMLQAAVNPQEVMDGGNWLALDQNQNLKEAALGQASSKAGFTHYPPLWT
jgi:Protein of unknown function (DUF3300)